MIAQPVADRLYELLPAIHRIKDAEQGLPLRGLFAILERELLALESDIDGLYDNWFIETCDEWVVHYIGDLLRIPRLHSGGIAGFSLRSYVANVLAYRRRKGTASVLEQMSHDVSGWPARVVEYQQRLVWNQHVNNARLDNLATLNLHDSNQLQLISSPFEKANYTAEIRNIDCRGGRYNINNIGIHLWRLQSYALRGVEARYLGGAYYSFDALGHEAPLYNRPQSETQISHLAEEINVPGPLRRRPLYDELNARREAISRGEVPDSVYFGQQPVLELKLNGEAIAAEQIMICNLRDRADVSPWVNRGLRALVDPVLGLIAVPEAISSTGSASTAVRVDVDYAYGFSADIGAGPYNRSQSIIGLFADEDDLWWAGVSEHESPGNGLFNNPADAVKAWNTSRANRPKKGVIAILDSATYNTPLTGADFGIQLESDESLLIIAASWRTGVAPAVEAWRGELNLHLVADGLRPLLNADIEVTANAEQASGELYLNGLMINGRLSVLEGDLDRLELSHSTLVPQAGGMQVLSDKSDSRRQNNGLSIMMNYCISGSLRLTDILQTLFIADSIIDAGVGPDAQASAQAIGGLSADEFGPSTRLQRCTILDAVKVSELELASETLFMAKVDVQRTQTGCVRYSYLELDSRVPRRFRCQPDLALLQRVQELSAVTGIESIDDLSEQEIYRVTLRLRPLFNSNTFGDPGYIQLQPRCAKEITGGAEDGAEIGVLNHLKQKQREDNIRASLAEYLRFGMNAGVYYVSHPIEHRENITEPSTEGSV